MKVLVESASAEDADPGTSIKEEKKKKRSRPFDYILYYLPSSCLTLNLRLPYDLKT